MRRYGFGLLILVVLIGFGRNAQTQSAAGGGLKAQITAVTVPATRRPVITFTVSDSSNKPLDLADLDADSVKFTIAVVKTDKTGGRDYSNYILTKVAGKNFTFKGESRKPTLAETTQPDVDHGGTISRVRPGVFSYTFKTALPAGYDARATHVVGGEMTRANRLYAAKPLFEFVPAGGKVQAQRELAETASCNSCHDPMSFHDGTAWQTGYCALCHTSQLNDPETGENLDFKYTFCTKSTAVNIFPASPAANLTFWPAPNNECEIFLQSEHRAWW